MLGGNGFIGSAIAKSAAERGLAVYSLSRSGRRPSTAEWTNSVTWIKGDCLRPETFSHCLPNVSAVVHSIGILFEKRNGQSATFESSNRDTLIAAASECTKHRNVRSFVYISAANVMPFFVDKRYIETKRAAEEFLLAQKSFCPVVVRPGLVYSDEDVLRMLLAAANSATHYLLAPLRRTFLERYIMNTVPPLNREHLAGAILRLIEKGEKGIFGAHDILSQ